jgi:hypothetical protein
MSPSICYLMSTVLSVVLLKCPCIYCWVGLCFVSNLEKRLIDRTLIQLRSIRALRVQYDVRHDGISLFIYFFIVILVIALYQPYTVLKIVFILVYVVLLCDLIVFQSYTHLYGVLYIPCLCVLGIHEGEISVTRIQYFLIRNVNSSRNK